MAGRNGGAPGAGGYPQGQGGYPRGQGGYQQRYQCGHELRPGARFCTIDGAPLATESIAPDAGQRVTPPEGWQPPGYGWQPPAGPPPPRPPDAKPPVGRHRARWPLAAGAIVLLLGGAAAAVFIAKPFQSEKAAPRAYQTSPRAAAAAVPASVAAAAPQASQSPPASPFPQTSPPPASQPLEEVAAQSLAGLLSQSVEDRSAIVNAVSDVTNCGPNLSQDPQTFDTAAASRQSLLTNLANLPDRSALPAQMLASLDGAWQASVAADQDFAQWAQDELAQGCTPNDQSDSNFQAAAGPDGQATVDKQAFVGLWNPIATQYGLTTYQWGQL